VWFVVEVFSLDLNEKIREKKTKNKKVQEPQVLMPSFHLAPHAYRIRGDWS